MMTSMKTASVIFAALCLMSNAARGQSPDRSDAILRELRSLKAMVADLQSRVERIEKALARGASPGAPLPAPAASAAPTAAQPAEPRVSPAPTMPLTTTTRQQCAATTRRGTRCSRMGQAGSAYCWQHRR
mgnify:CR=1 FL=1